MNISTVIVAAGRGKRFGTLKQFVEIGGKPLITYTLLPFQNHPQIQEIILVLPKNYLDFPTDVFPKVKMVAGGKERGDSVYQGLLRTQARYVLIHDGVRPLVSKELINRIIKGLKTHSAVVPALKITDTLKKHKNSYAQEQFNREEILAIQTPQGFKRNLLLEAYQKALQQGVFTTDDSGMVERFTKTKISVVPGDPKNIKITSKEDLEMVTTFLMRDLRVGFGYDIHPLVKEKKLILGGVVISHTHGPSGHSDGDALLHAIIDALLGAASLGDIGRHFPDTDPKFKDISSLLLLKETMKLLQLNGFLIKNIDATVVLERPKILPYIKAMQEKISKVLHIDPVYISIKGKTKEGLTEVGKGKAVEVLATAMLVKI